MSEYAKRGVEEMDVIGNYYLKHISAMTEEGLHCKADIAAELGWRDLQIDVLKERCDSFEKSIVRYQTDCASVEQYLGKALGYPQYKDDQEHFPGATEKDGVCVGEHTPTSIAQEAGKRIFELEAQLSQKDEVLEFQLRTIKSLVEGEGVERHLEEYLKGKEGHVAPTILRNLRRHISFLESSFSKKEEECEWLREGLVKAKKALKDSLPDKTPQGEIDYFIMYPTLKNVSEVIKETLLKYPVHLAPPERKNHP